MKTIIYAFLSLAVLLSLIMAFFTTYTYPALLPSGFTLKYILQSFSNKLFIQSLFSSISLGVSCGFCATLLGFLIGRGIVKLNIAHKEMLVGFFTVPLFFPAVSMFIGVHAMMLRLHLANTFLSVLIAHLLITIPYAMNIGIAYFSGIPKELEIISHLLGAGKLRTFRTIIMPLISGGAGLAFSMTFLISMSEYFATFLIGGGNIVTLSGIMYPYISNFDMQNSAVVSTAFLAINITVFAISNIWMKKRSYLY